MEDQNFSINQRPPAEQQIKSPFLGLSSYHLLCRGSLIQGEEKMNKTFVQGSGILTTILCLLLFGTPALADPVDDDRTMTGAVYRITNPITSAFGPADETLIPAGTRYAAYGVHGQSITGEHTLEAVQVYEAEAISQYDAGKQFRIDQIMVLNVSDLTDYCSHDADGDGTPDCDEFYDEMLTLLEQARDYFKFVYVYYLEHGDPAKANEMTVYLLDALAEICKVELIFGNEFFVDAIDFRYVADPYGSADVMVMEELGQLYKAFSDYSNALNVFTYELFYPIGDVAHTMVGDFFRETEYTLLNFAAGRKAKALIEIGKRLVLLGREDQVEQLFATAGVSTYLELAVLIEMEGTNLFHWQGEELITNAAVLKSRIDMLNDDINPFGYPLAYVPIHFYRTYLYQSHCDRPDAPDGLWDYTTDYLLPDAVVKEQAAMDADRTFDSSMEAAEAEALAVRAKLVDEVFALCGSDVDDDYLCDGGLMLEKANEVMKDRAEINLHFEEYLGIGMKIQNHVEQFASEATVTLHGAHTMSMNDFMISLLDSVRVEEGVEIPILPESSESLKRPVVKNPKGRFGDITGSSTDVDVDVDIDSIFEKINQLWDIYYDGPALYSSVQYNPSALPLANLEAMQTMLTAALDLEISYFETVMYVKDNLVDMGLKLTEMNLKVQEAQGTALEFLDLMQHFFDLLAEINAVGLSIMGDGSDDELLIYRIIRDQETFQALESLEMAAYFAYLAGRSLEYEYVDDIPVDYRDDIFMYRNTDQIGEYLVQLQDQAYEWDVWGAPDQMTFDISLVEHLLHLNDENLAHIPPEDREAYRYAEVQEFISGNLDPAQQVLEFPFTTSILEGNDIFTTQVFNHKLNMIRIDFVYDSPPPTLTEIETSLERLGSNAMRDQYDEIEYYEMGKTAVIGHVTSTGIGDIPTRATIWASVNDNGQGNETDDFCPRSVAATWIFKVDKSWPGNDAIDWTAVQDITFIFEDTTYHSLP